MDGDINILFTHSSCKPISNKNLSKLFREEVDADQCYISKTGRNCRGRRFASWNVRLTSFPATIGGSLKKIGGDLRGWMF